MFGQIERRQIEQDLTEEANIVGETLSIRR
jgi:hypothetical protein